MMTVMQWLRDTSILWMFGVFVLVVAYTFWPGRGATMKRDAEIPFKEDR